jgi:CRISPR/Cas system CSM-associated protein Csm4 (group 5 of RAMP superfamily)
VSLFCVIGTDEDPSLLIESFAIINIRVVSYIYYRHENLQRTYYYYKPTKNLLFCVIGTDEDPSLLIESFAIINIRVVSYIYYRHENLQRTYY